MNRVTLQQLDDLLDTAEVFMDNGDDFSPDETADIAHDPRLRFHAELNDLLAQDSGSAGTHAYEMMAAVEEINAGNTSVLIELIAGVVMMKLGDTLVEQLEPLNLEGPTLADPISVTFQPSDIDDMQRAYDMGVKRDGMHITVTLTRRETPTESWNDGEGESTEGARNQAPAPPERPVWAVRDGSGDLWICTDKPEAENELKRFCRDDPMAHIENRFCQHKECPSTGCNKPEVTSDA